MEIEINWPERYRNTLNTHIYTCISAFTTFFCLETKKIAELKNENDKKMKEKYLEGSKHILKENEIRREEEQH